MVKKDKGDREKTKGKCYWEEKERVYQLSGLARQSRFARYGTTLLHYQTWTPTINYIDGKMGSVCNWFDLVSLIKKKYLF